MAAHASVSRVSGRAGAGEGAQGVGAQGSLSAEARGAQQALALVHVLAEAERVAREARGARAPVAARRVAAQRALAAQARGPVLHAALVHVDTAGSDVGRVEGEADVAHTGRLLAVGLAAGVPTALHHVAGREAGLLGVSDEVVGAVAAVAPVRVGALGVLSAHRRPRQALVDVSASALWRGVYLLVSRLALAQEAALGVDAARVAAAGAAGQALVPVYAFLLVGRHLVSLPALAEVVDALGVGRAVVKRVALHAHDVPLAGLVRVSGVALGALAAVASGAVVAQASDGAGILGALVDVEALNPWVPRVALLAGAVVRPHVVQAQRVQAACRGPGALIQVVASGRELRFADVAELAAAEVAALRVGAVRVGAARVRALVDVLASELGVPGESWRALAVEASGGVDAGGARAAGEVGVEALVHVHASVVCAAGQRLVARLALALEAPGGVVAHRVGAARLVAALVHVVALDGRVARVSVGTDARVAAWHVVALGAEAARVGVLALVDVIAGHGGVAGEPLLALADVVPREVAALGVLHAQRCQRRNLALVDVVTVEAVAFVAREAGAVEAAHGVGAVREHVAWPVLALVLVWHLAALASVAVVAVAQVFQAGAVAAPRHLGMAVIPIRALEIPGELVGTLEALRHSIAQLRQLEQLQHLRGLVHLAAEEAVFQVQHEDLLL